MTAEPRARHGKGFSGYLYTSIRGIMERKEFGRLIAALREEHIDFSSKGMEVWTQSKLAREANLPVKTISQIEQGRKMNLDAQTMTQLASALKLTFSEQLELFSASSEVGVNVRNLGRIDAGHAFDMLHNLINEIRLPAFVCNQYTEILISNNIAIEVLNIPETLIESASQSVSGFTLIRAVFSPESSFRTLMGEYWTERAEASMRFFRTATLRHRHTKHFHKILAELSALPSFRELWFSTQGYVEDYVPDWTNYTYHHPILGNISFVAHISVTQTDQGALYLVTYLPCTKETTIIFEELIQHSGLHIERFAHCSSTSA